jgi:hypothetical protein
MIPMINSAINETANGNLPSPFDIPGGSQATPVAGQGGGAIASLAPMVQSMIDAFKLGPTPENFISLSTSLTTLAGGFEVFSGKAEALSAAIVTGLETFSGVFNQFDESIKNIPSVISESVGDLVMTHAITGNINFEFNNSVVEGMLGPAVQSAVQNILVKPMIIDALARQLKGYIDPRVFLDKSTR